MRNGRSFIWENHVNPHNSRRLSVIIVILIALFIPLSVFVSQQSQDDRQRAEEAALPIDRGVVFIESVPDPKVGKIPGELVVEFKPATGAAIAEVATTETRIRTRHKGTISKQRFRNSNVRTVDVPRGDEKTVINDLREDPSVASVEQDSYASILEIPNDPKFPQQYGFYNTGQKIEISKNKYIKGSPGADISMPKAWDVTTGKDDILVAVLDTGIDATHPELQGKVVKSIKISDADTVNDEHGHGTHIAGIIAAKTNNDIGVAGTCPKCKLLNIKVMSDNGQGKTSWITEGIDAAVAEGADVINISAGTFDDSPALQTAVDNALSKGVLIVAASGNCGDGSGDCPGTNLPMYPADYPEVISVSATDVNDEKPDYAEYGKTVDVAAPGDAILSTYKNGGYAIMNGTSMATPMVSGLAALLSSTKYGTTTEAIRDRIQSTADKIDGTGKYWQYGRINAARALGASESNPVTSKATPSPKDDTSDDVVPTRIPTKSAVFDGSPTPDVLTANLLVTAFVNGIGSSLPGGNTNPIHKNRVFIAEITDSAGDVRTVQGELQYSQATGGFTGSLPLKNFLSGDYDIALRSESTLFNFFPEVFTLAQPKSLTLPKTVLVIGDINGDDVIDIRDFNILAVCYSVRAPAKACTENIKEASDLNDDGKVNELDYNLFIRSLAEQLIEQEQEDSDEEE